VVAALSGIAVLLADDDLLTLEVLGELIADEGAAIRTAMSGREALEVLGTWTPDGAHRNPVPPKRPPCPRTMFS
jgi:CheY-like chemotaxis protein